MSQDNPQVRKVAGLSSAVRPVARFAATTLFCTALGVAMNVAGVSTSLPESTSNLVSSAITLFSGALGFWLSVRRPVDGGFDSMHPFGFCCLTSLMIMQLLPWQICGIKLYSQMPSFGMVALLAAGMASIAGSSIQAVRNDEKRKLLINEAKRRRALKISEQEPK